MHRILCHLLLSIALVFQGTGAVCASGAMAGATGNAMMGALEMATFAASCADSKGCAGCVGDHMSAQDCMQRCSVPAGIVPLDFFVPHLLLRDVLTPPSAVSLVAYHQIPPTPPPIA